MVCTVAARTAIFRHWEPALWTRAGVRWESNRVGHVSICTREKRVVIDRSPISPKLDSKEEGKESLGAKGEPRDVPFGLTPPAQSRLACTPQGGIAEIDNPARDLR
jgi:hypothetical protein